MDGASTSTPACRSLVGWTDRAEQTTRPRDRVLTVLRGDVPDMIPSFGEGPMDVTCLRGVMPEPTGDPVRDAIRTTEFFDNACIDLDVGLRVEALEASSRQRIYKYETGAIWRESYQPTFCREAIKFPINHPEDVSGFRMPNPRPPPLFPDMRKTVQTWKEAGYFVQGVTMGAWQGIYYNLTSFENILEWMAVEPEAAMRLFKLMGDYSIKTAELMLDAGVDMVFVASDLGSRQGLLFSARMFDQYVFPWLKEVCDLCHRRGAFLHLHSHGHIQDVMEGIVKAGVDLVNPIGPSDDNDLAMFKERWGQRIAILGGISTTIAQMSSREMDAHVAEVMRIGCRGGRFMPRTESGIPPMPSEKVKEYLRILEKYRQTFGRNGRNRADS